MKMELESTCVILRGFDGLQCHVELLSAGCSSSEQFPFIHFINTLSSVTSSWLENTQTLKHTQTHTQFLSLAALLRFFESRRASLRLITALQPLPSRSSPITGPQKKKTKKRKRPLSLSPWQPLSSSPFLHNQSDNDCLAVLPQPGYRGEVQEPNITFRGLVCGLFLVTTVPHRLFLCLLSFSVFLGRLLPTKHIWIFLDSQNQTPSPYFRHNVDILVLLMTPEYSATLILTCSHVLTFASCSIKHWKVHCISFSGI